MYPAISYQQTASDPDWWLANRSPNNILILLTDGEIEWNSDTNDLDWSQTTSFAKAAFHFANSISTLSTAAAFGRPSCAAPDTHWHHTSVPRHSTGFSSPERSSRPLLSPIFSDTDLVEFRTPRGQVVKVTEAVPRRFVSPCATPTLWIFPTSNWSLLPVSACSWSVNLLRKMGKTKSFACCPPISTEPSNCAPSTPGSPPRSATGRQRGRTGIVYTSGIHRGALGQRARRAGRRA